ncbi:MAG: Gx transporter family protein [Clostridia bacterium]|nr:Gx transporter family protein [Clostridia bacterium]
MRVNIKRLAVFAMLLAVSLILSYIENIVFSDIFLPGIKLGLSNISVVVALYLFGFAPALFLGISKSIVSLLVFGRLSGLLYSLFGIVFSVIVMFAIKKSGLFSVFGVGISGSAAHIAGQLLAACIMLSSTYPLSLFPFLCTVSVVCAAILYYPERIVLSFLRKKNCFE